MPDGLTPVLAEVYRRRFVAEPPESVREIAAALGVSTQRIYAALGQIERRLASEEEEAS